MLKDMSLIGFIEQTASNEPVPGGGSVAALSGSIAAALAEMVANLTIGKKKYMDIEDEMKEDAIKLAALRTSLIDLIDKDAASFDEVMKAFKLPKETDEEKAKRSMAIQEALKGAAEAPLDIARTAYSIMGYSEKMVLKGNKNAVTDGMVSAMLVRTSVLSAIFNVRINLSSIKDEDFVKTIGEEIDWLAEQVTTRESAIIDSVTF
jgi:formiminotetrahydrofolate cyclodeaminase